MGVHRLQIIFLEVTQMNAVGIDVSKEKSMVAIMRPFGEVVASPFEVGHTVSELDKLANLLENLNGETRVIMECTGRYFLPVAHALHEHGIYVSAVHAQLIHDFGDNTIRRAKNDKKDAVKIANYGLSYWLELPKFVPEEDIRKSLKVFSRQYSKYSKLKTMLKNNFISLTDEVFPGVNELFTSPPRKSDGHEKWLDFAAEFWHYECVCGLPPKRFAQKYKKWCKINGYNFSESKADDIYVSACGHVSVMPMNDTTKLLINLAADQLNAVSETLNSVSTEMKRLAQMLPEYPVVISFFGVGELLAAQIIAEVGDVFRFHKKSSLVSFAGLEPVENKSGKYQGQETISKQGSPHLRKSLFQVMDCTLKRSPEDNQIYQFLDRKRSEGKHYYSYMTAGSAKFLRIYYAKVREYLLNLEDSE
jgi:transposase